MAGLLALIVMMPPPLSPPHHRSPPSQHAGGTTADCCTWLHLHQHIDSTWQQRYSHQTQPQATSSSSVNHSMRREESHRTDTLVSHASFRIRLLRRVNEINGIFHCENLQPQGYWLSHTTHRVRQKTINTEILQVLYHIFPQ